MEKRGKRRLMYDRCPKLHPGLVKVTTPAKLVSPLPEG